MLTTGQRLRQLRKSVKGMTQGKLGRLVGHNQRWISERERGTVEASVEDAKLIASALGFNAELVIDDGGAVSGLYLLAGRSTLEDVGLANQLLLALPNVSADLRDALQLIANRGKAQDEKKSR